jgi:hypothetical protein
MALRCTIVLESHGPGTSRTAQCGNLTAVAYFNAGVRVYDIREPFSRRK